MGRLPTEWVRQGFFRPCLIPSLTRRTGFLEFLTLIRPSLVKVKPKVLLVCLSPPHGVASGLPAGDVPAGTACGRRHPDGTSDRTMAPQTVALRTLTSGQGHRHGRPTAMSGALRGHRAPPAFLWVVRVSVPTV